MAKDWKVASMRMLTVCDMLIYLRPNLLNTETFISFLIKLLLLLLSRRSDGSAHATIDVLLFLLSWFQNLLTVVSYLPFSTLAHEPTWNEHRRLSSTLIMAPALSNSPQ